MTHAPRSRFDALRWPALPSPSSAVLLVLSQQLEASQWLPAEQLQAHQFAQLEALLTHASASVPFYRERLAAAGWQPGDSLDAGRWADLPVLTRRDVQSAGASLHSSADLAHFGPLGETGSSGSVGEPVRIRKTAVDNLYWMANTLRDHQWHERDVSGGLASIRVWQDRRLGRPPHGTVLADWGPPASELWETGPSALLDVTAGVEEQAAWLMRHDPDYLVILPSCLQALLDFCERHELMPRFLREVRTLGETISPGLRARCSEQWQVPVVDTYSSQEVGYLALQCPQAGGYHVMAESMLLEVLDDAGLACAPGEIGRVVVTPLHALAMPLIRYEMGDLAEQGAPCACGRGLPTLARILGRTRNLVTLPGGRRQWPLVGYARYREIAPVRQYQFVQHSLREVEVRLVTERVLAGDEERRLAEVMQEALGHPFTLRFRYYHEHIPRGPGGKFEEFVSLLEK